MADDAAKRARKEIHSLAAERLQQATGKHRAGVSNKLHQLCSALPDTDAQHLHCLIYRYRAGATAAAVHDLVEALRSLQTQLGYSASQQVPAWQFTDKSRELWLQWEREGTCRRDARAPQQQNAIPISQKQELDKILNSNKVALLMPNQLCSIAAVDEPSSALDGQLQAVANVQLATGMMIPWIAQLHLDDDADSEIDKYEFEFQWRSLQRLKARPDARCAATYVNDYAGPDRSDENKQAQHCKLNCAFCVTEDRHSRPYIFLQTLKLIREGEPLWIDYGAQLLC